MTDNPITLAIVDFVTASVTVMLLALRQRSRNAAWRSCAYIDMTHPRCPFAL
jgi:hypothetical protein